MTLSLTEASSALTAMTSMTTSTASATSTVMSVRPPSLPMDCGSSTSSNTTTHANEHLPWLAQRAIGLTKHADGVHIVTQQHT
jgi:hypothetical protein